MKAAPRTCVALLVGLAWFSCAHAQDKRSRSGIELHPVKQIGAGWGGDGFAWMSFVAFNAKGDRIASDAASSPGDRSSDLTIWTFPGGRLVRRLPGQPWAVSQDWTYYATANEVRRMDNGAVVLSAAPSSFASFAFSPRGDLVAESAAGQVRLVELQTRNVLKTIEPRGAFALAFSPRGDLLATGHWDLVSLWSTASGRRVATLRGLGRYAKSLSFSPDGKQLAVGSDWGILQIWDVRRHVKLRSIDLQGSEVSDASFTADGALLAAGTYGTGTVWLVNARTGRAVARQKVSDLGCGSAAFSPNGQYLITPSTGGLIRWPYDRGGTVRVFRVVRTARR